tara:strand:- start:2430 stop:2756 length:327 start_codon:yes stop_codon:yes gene_type:complete
MSKYIYGYVFPKTDEEKKAQFKDMKEKHEWFAQETQNNQKGAMKEFSGSIEIDGVGYFLDVSPLYDSKTGKAMRKVTLNPKTVQRPQGSAAASQQEALDDDFEDDIPF